MPKTALIEPVPTTVETVVQVLAPEFEAVCVKYAKSKLDLKAKTDKLKVLKAEVDELEDQIEENVDQYLTPENGTEIHAGPYLIEVSARTRESLPIDKKALFEALGATLFVELASFSITDLKKYLTGQQLETLLKYEHTGSRRLSVKKG